MVQYEIGDEIKMVERQIHNILADEEIFWKQCSRANQLKEWDKNTKFFHHKASSRKKKNRLWGIEDEIKRLIENVEEVEHEFGTYFTNLFTTSKPSQDQIAIALLRITSRVLNDMNEQLDKPFSAKEVVEPYHRCVQRRLQGLMDCQQSFIKNISKRLSPGLSLLASTFSTCKVLSALSIIHILQ